jgi:DNA-binding beta-propeller fold protein YncE
MSAAYAKETYVQNLTWGSQGWGDGQFAGNAGLCVNSGIVTVADCDNHRVQVFDTNGNYQRQFSTLSSGLPMAVVPAGTAYYVLSYGSGKVQIYNSIGIVMGSFGSAGSEPQQMQNPRGMALNPVTNMIYIADTGNNRVSQFTTGGVFVRTIGTVGSGDGQLSVPYGVALDAAGNVYVADRDNYRIQKFTSTGGYLCQWPLTNQGFVDTPTSIAVAGDHVFVGGGSGTVTKFTTSGDIVCRFGSAGTGIGQFSSVNGIAVDDTGRLFISDGGFNGCRIQRFVPNNTPTAPTSVIINPKPYTDGSNLTP